MALIFVIEADNLIAVLVFSAKQQQEADNLVEVAKRNNVRIGQAEIKRDAVLVSVLMFVVCLKIEALVEIFSSDCDLSTTLAAMFFPLGQPAFMIYKCIGNLAFGEKPNPCLSFCGCGLQDRLWA